MSDVPPPDPRDAHLSDAPPAPRPRAMRRWILGSVVGASLLALAAYALLPDGKPTSQIHTQPAAVQTVTPAAIATPGPSASADAALRPIIKASASPKIALSPTRPAHAKPNCTRHGYVDVTQPYTYGEVKVAARTNGTTQLCPGERIRIFWAAYTADANGVRQLFRSQVHYLDRAHPTWTTNVVTQGTCRDSWYMVKGDVNIPKTIPAGVLPFGLAKFHWDAGGWEC